MTVELCVECGRPPWTRQECAACNTAEKDRAAREREQLQATARYYVREYGPRALSSGRVISKDMAMHVGSVLLQEGWQPCVVSAALEAWHRTYEERKERATDGWGTDRSADNRASVKA
jgi:hypothetical protein